MNSIRVLHVLSRFDPGGIEKWLADFDELLSPDGGVVFDYLCISGHQGVWDDQIKGKIIYAPNLKKGIIRFFLALFGFIYKNRARYSIFHIHLYRFSAFIAFVLKMFGCKLVIVHAHNDKRVLEKKLPFLTNRVRKAYGAVAKLLFFFFADVCVAAGRGAAEDLFGRLNGYKTKILYCGVRLIEQKSDDLRNGYFKEFGISEEDKVLFNVGSLTSQKNQIFLLHVIAALCVYEPNIKLFIVGDGPMRTSLEDEIAKLKLREKVFLLGNRNDVLALLQNISSGFLFPSLFEGLGLAVVEAQFCGNMCFVSSEIPEEANVEPDLFVRLPLSVDAWVEHIKKKIGVLSPASNKVRKENQFSIEYSMDRFLSLYNELAGLKNMNKIERRI